MDAPQPQETNPSPASGATLELAQRLRRPGPKRLLALDGGGIRGVLTLGYLARIEELLRHRHGRNDLVLSDYFDLIGGTSTGSIIAAMLALGAPVEEIRSLYLQLGRDAFQLKKTWLGGLGRVLGARFDEQPLVRLLRQHLGERTLASPDLRSGLMIVVKRIDTGSVWPVVNLPDHRYYEANKELKLWQVVRASTAAPTFFRPERVDDVGAGEEALFVDGGVSMHGNPALLLLMAATLRGFGLGWPLGEEQLLLCSVGTGAVVKTGSVEALARDRNLPLLPIIFQQLLYDASELNETILQWLSRSPTARTIDSQIGDLGEDLLAPMPLLRYLRYDIELSQAALQQVGLSLEAPEVAALHDMSDTRNIERLDAVGRAAAVAVVDDHFPPAFDLP